MRRLDALRDGIFRDDARLKASIAEVAAASFVDNIGLLERDFERRDCLYLLRDERGEVMSFFMVTWGTLEIEGRQLPTLNAGLTAARPDQKGKGTSIKLYRRAVLEAQEREHVQQCKLIVWGTLASPIVYRLAGKVFANLQPSLDGTYSDDAAQVARAVRRKLGIAHTNGSHPFAFPGLVAGVCFTEAERRRIGNVCRAKSFTLFEQLGIDEVRGDRLLFVAAVPSTADTTRQSNDQAGAGGVLALSSYPLATRNGDKDS